MALDLFVNIKETFCTRHLVVVAYLTTILPTGLYLLGAYDAVAISSPIWIIWQACHLFYFLLLRIGEKKVQFVDGHVEPETSNFEVSQREEKEVPQLSQGTISLAEMISPNDPPDIASLIKFFYTMTELDKLDISGPISLAPMPKDGSATGGSFYDTSQWRPITDPKGEIAIFEKTDQDMFFKVFAQVNTSSASAFDLFVDIHKRPLWDQLCEQGEVAGYLDHWTRLVYMRMKSIWPTTARDILLRATIRNLGNERYLMISKSTEHASYPPVSGCIRMHANCIGQLFIPLGKDRCQIIQLADTDMKGWIPKSVVGFVATKAIPRAFSKITDALLAEPLKATSDTFLKIALDSSGMITQSIQEQPHITPVSDDRSNIPSTKEGLILSNALAPFMEKIDHRLQEIEANNSKKSRKSSHTLGKMHRVFMSASPYIMTTLAVIQVYFIMKREYMTK
jgi:hypothetical protein